MKISDDLKLEVNTKKLTISLSDGESRKDITKPAVGALLELLANAKAHAMIVDLGDKKIEIFARIFKEQPSPNPEKIKSEELKKCT